MKYYYTYFIIVTELLLLLKVFESLSIASKTLLQCNRMQQWLVDGGGYVHPHVEICEYPNLGFGLIASQVRGNTDSIAYIISCYQL